MRKKKREKSIVGSKEERSEKRTRRRTGGVEGERGASNFSFTAIPSGINWESS